MAEHPCFPLWTDAYLGDTGHLTTIEHGAYLLLLITMWRNGGSLPDDDRMLARYARLTPGQWKRVKPAIWPFFEASEGQILQGRLTDEYKAVRQKSKRQSSKAKSRWLKTKETDDATASPGHSQSDASLTLTLNTTLGTSVPNDGGAVEDATEIVWGKCKDWLVSKGIPDKQARSLIGKWLKASTPQQVRQAFIDAHQAKTKDPIPYITRVLEPDPEGDWDRKADSARIGALKILKERNGT